MGSRILTSDYRDGTYPTRPAYEYRKKTYERSFKEQEHEIMDKQVLRTGQDDGAKA